jgi:hypothetical protein
LICLPSLPLSAAVAIYWHGHPIARPHLTDTTEPVDVGLQEIPHVGHFDDTFSGP